MTSKHKRRLYRAAGLDGRSADGRAFRWAWRRYAGCFKPGSHKESAMAALLAHSIKTRGYALDSREFVLATRAYPRLKSLYPHYAIQGELEKVLETECAR